MNPPRRLLFILPTFAPGGGTGSLRMVKWIKYLDRRGWQCDVVTRADTGYEYRDESLESDVPASVTRHEFDFSRPLWSLLPSLWRRVRELSREHSYRVVVTTSPEDRNHLYGWLASLTGIPWVADLRDPVQGRFTGLKRWMLRRSTAVTTAWPVDDLLEPSVAEHVTTQWIPNGFDPDDFSDSTPTENERRTFVHTGSLHKPNQSPIPLINALGRLKNDAGLDLSTIRIRLMGAVIGDELRDKVRNAIETQDLGEVVELEPFVSHKQSVRAMESADVGIIFKRQPALSYKFCEYLGAELPMLILHPSDSPMGRIAKGKQGIYWADWEDTDGLVNQLRRLITEQPTDLDGELREQFSLPTIEQTLNEFLEGI